VHIDRPHDDYKLDIQITKVVLNSELETARFQLAQPAGAEVVRVTANGADSKTGALSAKPQVQQP
jgi:hypothetical protein